MSHHDHAADHVEPDPADSKSDVWAAFFAVIIPVVGVVYFVSQHGV
jgi:hypothetical protein